MSIHPLARTLLAMAAAPWCVCAQAQLTVAIYNYAGAPRTEMAAAAEKARMAFLAVGIESRWVVSDREGVPPDAPDGASLELLVMPRLRTPLNGFAARFPAGYAMTRAFSHPRGYAFYDVAKRVADRTIRPVDLVLACILVHETGHLLGLNHQPWGVMRANLEAVDMDNLAMGRAFNAGEAKKLHAAVDRPRTLRAAARP